VVRLVVLVFVFISVVALGTLSGCSVLPASSMGEQHDPRQQQSREEHNGSLQNDIVHLDEGEHHPAVQVLLTQAEEARQQGQNQQALSYLDRARQIQPRNSAIFYRQAWLNYQLGELQQAQQLLQRATLFLRQSVSNYSILQRRLVTLQNKVDAKLGFE